jgi:hypothetical protein
VTIGAGCRSRLSRYDPRMEALGPEGYTPAAGSALLPTLDLAHLGRCAAIENQTEALRVFLEQT